MSVPEHRVAGIDTGHVIYLPPWGRIVLFSLLALLGLTALAGSAYFLLSNDASEKVVSLMSVAQTAIGAAVVVLFVLFSERQLSTRRLYEKTNQFLETHLLESLARIEIPQSSKTATVTVREIKRPARIHGQRKDIFGINYLLELGEFRMKIWVGINVKRLSVIYFVNADGNDVTRCQEAFHFTFAGASKVGYSTHFEHAEIEGESIVSMWSTVLAENAILGNAAEQLFWSQDVAMMTQSVARTAMRHGLQLHTETDPGPL
jgi:hypothetical protein